MSLRDEIERALAGIGAVAIAGLAILVAMAAVATRRGFSARDEPTWLEATVARAVRLAGIPERARALKSPLPITESVLRDARAHWADHCAGCHANNGSGDIPMGRNLFPKAPDMRQEPTQKMTDGELYYVIQNGIRMTGMPAWGAPVDDDPATWGLVAFIRHLPSLTPEEEAEMKKLNPKSVHEAKEEEAERDFLNEMEAAP